MINPKTLKMVLTASLCDAPNIKSLSKVNNVSTYAVVGLPLTILKIYHYQYWTMAEMQ
jgi:hypothetical protein